MHQTSNRYRGEWAENERAQNRFQLNDFRLSERWIHYSSGCNCISMEPRTEWFIWQKSMCSDYDRHSLRHMYASQHNAVQSLWIGSDAIKSFLCTQPPWYIYKRVAIPHIMIPYLPLRRWHSAQDLFRSETNCIRGNCYPAGIPADFCIFHITRHEIPWSLDWFYTLYSLSNIFDISQSMWSALRRRF